MTWPVVELQAVCQTGSGTTPSRERSDYYGGSIPWVKSGELRETEILRAEEHVTTAAMNETSLKLVPPGALLVAMYGATVGRVGLLGIEATTNQAICHVIPDRSKVDIRYMFHLLQSRASELVARGVGGAQPNISQGTVKQLKIPLPPLEEQKRIAAILDQADALRRLRRRALDRLNTLGQAIFHEMFVGQSEAECGWQTVALADLVPAHDRINYGIVQPGDHDPEGVPIIRVGDLLTPRVDFTGIKRVSKAIDESYQRSRLKGGEILVGCVGSIGTTVIAPTSFAGANIARAVARIPLNSDVCDLQFVCHQLRSHRVQNYLKKEIRLVAQPTLNIKQIREIEILLPPLELQRRFSSRIDVLQKATTLESSALKNSECLFTSLQHRAFRGKL